ncbi:hypothetical protein RB594_006131 [Gaeumannomyces avenae]
MASASASPPSAVPSTTTTSSVEPLPAPPSRPDADADPETPDADDDDDDDPIVESYHVLLKPELPAHQQLLVLQHPNRNVDYLGGATELRLKPASGMVELDMPLGHGASYDRAKGVNWGKALAQANASRLGGAHGLAGGFGVGAPALRITAAEAKAGGVGGGGRRGGGGGGGDDDIEVIGGGVAAADFNEAIRRDKVLRTHTLGGQIATGDSQTRYMIGVFSGDNIHLTPITNLALLRPQLHHIDAKAELERATRRGSEPGANGPGGGGGGQGSGGGGGPGGSSGPAPRAVHMTVKSAGAVESDDSGAAGAEVTMADRLKAVQTEQWRRLAYVDESADDAWAVYEESLVHRGLEGGGHHHHHHSSAAAAAAEEDKGKGKEQAKAAAAAAADDHDGGEEGRLVDRVARLGTGWDETKLLHVVSGLELPPPGAAKAEDEQGGGAQPSRSASAAPPQAASARKASKLRAGATSATAMDVD